MRRSKRLAAKKSSKFSETEGSSQKEAVDVKGDDVEASDLNTVDQTVAQPAPLDHVDNNDDDDDRDDGGEDDDENENDKDDGDQDEDVHSESSERSTDSEDDEGKEKDFITLSTEFQRKLKE